MYQLSIRLERISTGFRRGGSREDAASTEIYIQVKGQSPLDAIQKGLRFLVSEHDDLNAKSIDTAPAEAAFDNEEEI